MPAVFSAKIDGIKQEIKQRLSGVLMLMKGIGHLFSRFLRREAKKDAGKPKGAARRQRSFQLEPLETRFLLSADLAPNEAPVVNDQTFRIEESTANAAFRMGDITPNGTVVGTILATDPDGDTLSYSVTGGTGQTAFAVNSAGASRIEISYSM